MGHNRFGGVAGTSRCPHRVFCTTRAKQGLYHTSPIVSWQRSSLLEHLQHAKPCCGSFTNRLGSWAEWGIQGSRSKGAFVCHEGTLNL